MGTERPTPLFSWAARFGEPVYPGGLGPEDLVKPFPSWGFLTAGAAAIRMASRRKKRLSEDEKAFILRFAKLRG
jgi:hypothetical protein